jgi:hypothetical protein
MGVEKEVFPECGKGGGCDSSKWVGFDEVGGEEKGEVSFSCGSSVIEVCSEYEGAEVFDDVE